MAGGAQKQQRWDACQVWELPTGASICVLLRGVPKIPFFLVTLWSHVVRSTHQKEYTAQIRYGSQNTEGTAVYGMPMPLAPKQV